jgi:hypothetical protein
MPWILQQINNGNGMGPTVPGEFVASPGAVATISGANVPLYERSVCVYNNQQHFTYNDKNGNLQDVWWDGDANQWNLQQINNTDGNGATVPGKFIASPDATPTAPGPFFVCVYKNQQHFTYVGGDGILQDVWWDGDANQWKLQQINNPNGIGPIVPGEFIASPTATAATAEGTNLLFAFITTSNNSPTTTRMGTCRTHGGTGTPTGGTCSRSTTPTGTARQSPANSWHRRPLPHPRIRRFASAFTTISSTLPTSVATGSCRTCGGTGTPTSGTCSRSTTPTEWARPSPASSSHRPTLLLLATRHLSASTTTSNTSPKRMTERICKMCGGRTRMGDCGTGSGIPKLATSTSGGVSTNQSVGRKVWF